GHAAKTGVVLFLRCDAGTRACCRQTYDAPEKRGQTAREEVAAGVVALATLAAVFAGTQCGVEAIAELLKCDARCCRGDEHIGCEFALGTGYDALRSDSRLRVRGTPYSP